jgi:S-adenosylmethionine synthetase
MYEVVSPSHPDKIADHIAGALVDLSYTKQADPRVAIEVLIGHGTCHIINETSVSLPKEEVAYTVYRIAGPDVWVDYVEVPQDEYLASNQKGKIRCGDNGIFKGVPLTAEQLHLKDIARNIYTKWPSDGKYLIDDGKLVICQSNAKTKSIKKLLKMFGPRYSNAKINPLGEWTGGTNVDCGATNRKLGSDMADSCTGGGLHGKDLSKGDVSINIYAFIKAQITGKPVKLSCAIGDEFVDDKPYSEVVEIARGYIKEIGGFEKLAEWGYQVK